MMLELHQFRFRTSRARAGAVLLLLVGACSRPTSFQGEAKFPGGARGCYERCAAENMDMASFVFVGEYSTACACKPRMPPPQAPTASKDAGEGAVTAAVAGVEIQRRLAEQQRAQQANAFHPH